MDFCPFKWTSWDMVRVLSEDVNGKMPNNSAFKGKKKAGY
jgi:hypothetical protein